ncbi:C6 finger domain protein [Pyrenophora tritici-repentis]|nr:C6 finger domain protein [Pyrenophora tritici-repentis]
MSHDFAHQVNAQPYSPAPQHFPHPGMADPNMQSRQQTVAAYPSPHSYPSPSMQSSYTYPPPQGQQSNEGGYRSSPQGANMSLPPLNLPPIRVQDGQQPQAQQQPQQQPMGSPLPPPQQQQQQQHQMPQYYAHPAHAQPGPPMMANMGPQFNSMRYQLPPQPDQRVLSGGRHKKEIKRRTKTGCLTCRKRRIKPSFHAIDPALAQADSALQSQHYNGVHAMDPAMRAPGPAFPPPGPPMKGKRLTMSETFAICNHSPPDVPQRTSPVPREIDEEFTRIFVNDYLAGLDMILETNWFSTSSNALNRVFSDRSLHEEAAFFTDTIKYKTSDADMGGVFSQEARLLWHLLGTCKHNTPSTNGSVPESDDLLLREARARFDILEALLTNHNLDSNPIRQLTYPAGLDDEKRMEIDFWQHLGDFVLYSDADNAPPGAADNALAVLRGVLRMHEVRDAIYSIAVARHYGNRIGGFPNSLPAPSTHHPDSDLSKLTIAMTFISHESRAATQQVLARICDMAMVSWNVSRMPSNHQPGVFLQ